MNWKTPVPRGRVGRNGATMLSSWRVGFQRCPRQPRLRRNGATTLSSWRVVPTRLVAEDPLRCLAAMGPRRCRRGGKRIWEVQCSQDFGKPEWGHDVAVVEGGYTIAPDADLRMPTSRARRNGATTLPSWRAEAKRAEYIAPLMKPQWGHDVAVVECQWPRPLLVKPLAGRRGRNGATTLPSWREG